MTIAQWCEEADVNAFLAKMKRKFVDKDIPVVMREFEAMRRGVAGQGL